MTERAVDVAGIVLDALLEGRVREARAVAAQHPRVHLDDPPRGYLMIAATRAWRPSLTVDPPTLHQDILRGVLAHCVGRGDPFGRTHVFEVDAEGLADVLWFFDEDGYWLMSKGFAYSCQVTIGRGFSVVVGQLDHSFSDSDTPRVP